MIEFGKKITPKKTQPVASDTTLRGPHWSIEQVGEEYVFEYISGSHGGGLKTHIVTKEDFEAVKSGEMSDHDLLLKYGLS